MSPRRKPNLRLERARSFAEVLVISLVIQAILNFIFEMLGIQLRLAVYETALIWLFCK
jgi:hypothetical protein